ncbi:hypothetical protein DFH06DRAFT_1142579 [Mycena polygramma]|nr:hypothetical protein DFH06DRAFT_1142579 [Mycena polygramma]
MSHVTWWDIPSLTRKIDGLSHLFPAFWRDIPANGRDIPTSGRDVPPVSGQLCGTSLVCVGQPTATWDIPDLENVGQPMDLPAGSGLNVLPSPNPTGGDLNVLPSPNPAGGDLNMLPSPNPTGGGLNVLPSPNPAGGDLNMLPSPNPAGGDLNVLPWPSPVGSGWMCYQRTTIHLIPTGGGVDMLAAAGCAAELHQPGRNIWQPIPSDTSHPYHCYFRAIRPQKLHFIPAAGAQ